jgi:hypothetical protein
VSEPRRRTKIEVYFIEAGTDPLVARVHTRANIKAELLGSGFASLNADQVRNVETPTLLVTGQRSPGVFHRLTDWLPSGLMPLEHRI